MKKKLLISCVNLMFAIVGISHSLRADTYGCDGDCCWVNIDALIHPNNGCYGDGHECERHMYLAGCPME
jgi:hypothetical protein